MNRLEFFKLEGLGNDFVLVDCRRGQPEPDAWQASRLADRHAGVGCDQVLILRPARKDGLCAYVIYNADGSRADQCGNGARCIAWWLFQRSELPDGGVLESPAGPVSARICGTEMVEVSLAEPGFAAPAEPWPMELDLEGKRHRLYTVDLGNPHAVIELDAPPEAASCQALARALEASGRFPNGVNLGTAFRMDESTLSLRVHERGAGLTRACGSGACAAACALVRAGRATSPVSVVQPGGSLVIEWHGDGSRIVMTGPAREVFRGEIQWQTITA